MVMETTFCELRSKEVINMADGRRLGRVLDIVIDLKTGKVMGIVVPGERSSSIFRRCEELYIPWCDICKIGDDVIIVELKGKGGGCGPRPPRPPHPPGPRPPRYVSAESYREEEEEALPERGEPRRPDGADEE